MYKLQVIFIYLFIIITLYYLYSIIIIIVIYEYIMIFGKKQLKTQLCISHQIAYGLKTQLKFS